MENQIFYDAIMPAVYTMSVLTFILFAYDKHCATYHKFRIPEAVLLIASVLAGAFGGLCGMIFCNHKTKKPAFYITVPVALFVQILIAVAMMWWL